MQDCHSIAPPLVDFFSSEQKKVGGELLILTAVPSVAAVVAFTNLHQSLPKNSLRNRNTHEQSKAEDKYRGKELLPNARVRLEYLSYNMIIESSTIAACVAVLMLLVLLVLVVVSQVRRPPLMTATGFKAVLVTGFGYLLAKRLDAAGYKVFAGCLDAKGEGAATLRDETSPKLEVVQLDVTKEDQIEAARVTVADSLEGRVMWAVVNNAGMASHVEFELTPREHFRKMVDVNLIGLVSVTRAFLPLIRASKGRVINISSMAGIVLESGKSNLV
ncbi:D-beta-hydroxybutyrate dehydrogenase, mitochondrial [Elysia marginata]|uniref:D-beta-hydroxybutyrate dehydrogenase, mitochondrial n=1 Tax=Elysia marginata TaxID=1093978 RepID=A0AAV4GVI5_9GAST|nr:D-beta-hydroxybutyrate dehydrogenase, mitochondrial [Elysia marginata]